MGAGEAGASPCPTPHNPLLTGFSRKALINTHGHMWPEHDFQIGDHNGAWNTSSLETRSPAKPQPRQFGLREALKMTAPQMLRLLERVSREQQETAPSAGKASGNSITHASLKWGRALQCHEVRAVSGQTLPLALQSLLKISP